MTHSVVVLNANGQYWGEATLRRVLRWIATNKIEILVEKEDEVIRSFTVTIKLPLVVRLLKFAGYKIKHSKVDYSKWAVFERDNDFCQYWHHDQNGRRFMYRCTEDDKTLDHVIPKDRGGAMTFENSVTCCRHHNVIVKRNRTPEEAGLQLIRKPFTPRARQGEWVVMRFNFNPHKLAHRYYAEKILGMAVI